MWPELQGPQTDRQNFPLFSIDTQRVKVVSCSKVILVSVMCFGVLAVSSISVNSMPFLFHTSLTIWNEITPCDKFAPHASHCPRTLLQGLLHGSRRINPYHCLASPNFFWNKIYMCESRSVCCCCKVACSNHVGVTNLYCGFYCFLSPQFDNSILPFVISWWLLFHWLTFTGVSKFKIGCIIITILRVHYSLPQLLYHATV